MTQETTKRRPYVRPLGKDFWTQDKFRKIYLIKEFTAFPLFLFYIEILWLLWTSHHQEVDPRAYLIGQEASNLIAVLLGSQAVDFLLNPFVVIFNSLILLIAIFNSLVWFHLTPKAINLVKDGKKVNAHKMTGIITIAWLLFTLFIILVFVNL